MRFSDDWLRDCLETDLPPSGIGEKLTGVGIPLDSLEAREGDGPGGPDTVYHFDIPSNRPDCMSHRGLARELGAARAGRLRDSGKPAGRPPAGAQRSPVSPDAKPGAAAPGPATVKVEAADLCGRYTALVLQGVTVGPSPDWASRRLQAIGLRPINSVVDATNYTLWEMGQPLHAFDLSRLSGRSIRVRRAKVGERLITLDGVERKLDPDTLVIADDRRAVALAGVMGGKDSEIGQATTEVLLESAHFKPAAVRATARKFGLHTDASHRFERGADPEITLEAARRCATLIAEWSGGRLAGEELEDRPIPPEPRQIALRPDRVGRLLGLQIPAEAMRSILERLQCRVESRDPEPWLVSPPSFRGDLALEEDLIEEIARHHGYERIPVTLPRVFLFPAGRPESLRRLERVRRAARECGFAEALNLSLVSEAGNRAFGDPSGGVRILNPMTEGLDRLRGSLIHGLLQNLAHNLNHNAGEARLFETGRVFQAAGKGAPPDEEERLGLVAAGRAVPRHWGEPPRAPDLFDVKGALEAVARLNGLARLEWTPERRGFLAEGRGAGIRAGARVVGWAGELAAPLRLSYEVEVPVFASEISLRELAGAAPGGPIFRHAPLSRTPTVSRDLSLLVDEKHSWSEVEAVIRSVERAPVISVRLFDRYTDPPVPPGKVSLAVNVVFSTPGRTMLSEEVSEHLERIVQRLRQRLGAALRGQ